MLELRPTCEHCNAALPANSPEARICSFECTFCRRCVEELLLNVCPNCGGGFSPRPVRPSRNLRNENCLGTYPAGSKVVHRPVDIAEHAKFVEVVRHTPPAER